MDRRQDKVARTRRVVPWFSISEWKAVYDLIYSNNIVEQREGLDRLLAWKARCRIPEPVECTLLIFQVLLGDPEIVSRKSIIDDFHHPFGKYVPVALDHQLRILYSTAIMRFLNVMFSKEMYNRASTMFDEAAMRGIPGWIVNLRHDAAHSSILPELSVLRSGAIFISNWLHENYWKCEVQVMSDWHVSENEMSALYAREEELHNIMEFWEALSLYKLAGKEKIHSIPDKDLKMKLSTMMESELKDGNPNQTFESLKISKVIAFVLRQLVLLFKKCRSYHAASVLVERVVSGEFFLPSDSVMKMLYPSGLESGDILRELPSALVDSCKDLVCVLWALDVIPALSTRLVALQSNPKEGELRKNIAALWLHKILLSCLKVREAMKIFSALKELPNDGRAVFEEYSCFYPNCSKSEIFSLLAHEAVDKQRSDLEMGFTFDLSQVFPTSLTSRKFLHQSMSSPTKFTHLFLPCLLELCAPRVSFQSRKLLLLLLDTYNNQELGDLGDNRDKVYSVNDLLDVSPSKEDCTSAGSTVTDTGMETIDSHASGFCSQSDVSSAIRKLSSPGADSSRQSGWHIRDHLDWQKCPLGLLPWQRERESIDKYEIMRMKTKQQVGTWSSFFVPAAWSESHMMDVCAAP